ncbi:MAG: hypothetical protein FK733_07800 [Asgard group archaeon]|nr:hypothetical protein [Asgard group archaeon]
MCLLLLDNKWRICMLSKKKFFACFITLISLSSVFVQVQFINSYNSSLSPNSTTQNTSFNLKKIGQFTGAQEVVDVFVNDYIGYVADQVQGLLIVNLSNPEIPVLINSYQDEDNSVYDVFVEDEIAFVAHGRAGFKILDVSNPLSIIELGEYNDGGISWKIFIQDNTAFIADRIQGLEILDISNKNAPIEIGTYSSQPFDIFIQDELAYLAAGVNNGLEIIDLSDLAAPKKIGEISFGFVDTISISVIDGYAFLGTKGNGLKVVKVSRPKRPKLISEYLPESDCNIWGIYSSNNFIYMACELDGVQILDASDVTNLYKVGHFSDDSGKAFNVFVNQDNIFLADFDDGLEIFEWKTTQPVPTVNDYHVVDTRIINFNHSVGPFAADVFLGDESIGLNLSIFLDVGLMSPINITVEAPRIIAPDDFINLKIGITAEASYFWGRFEGTVEFTTPLGSSEIFSLEEVGIPQHVQLAAFKTFIGENIDQDSQLFPMELWSQDILNYTLSLVMTPNFNVTGSAIVSAKINNTLEYFDLLWTQDRDEILVPVKIPADIEEFYAIPLEELQFMIDDLHLDLNAIQFDVLLGGLIPVYSWELNESSLSGITSNPMIDNYHSLLPIANQNNNTLLYLDGIYPLGTFIITIYLSEGIQLPIWSIFLTLLGIIALLVIPFLLIATSSRRKNEEQSRRTNEE